MTESEIRQWLLNFVAELLDVDIRAIDLRMPLDRLGVDSAMALVLAADLGAALRTELSPVKVFGYRTIDAMAEHLAGE